MTVPPLLVSHRSPAVPCASRGRCGTLRKPVLWQLLLVVLLCLVLPGCGSSLKREATEQLLASDAVDRSVGSIDFRELAGRKVYFDTTYIKTIKGVGFVNSDYIISAMRQQMVAARCLLQDKKEDAEFVVEGRVGVLGIDGNEVTYGIPSSSGLSTAASLMPTAPPLPVIPEMSFAKKNDQRGAARVGFFAYHRETGEPVWQSGISDARSTAKDSWVLGAGPFQSGTIYSGTQFAGAKLKLPLGHGDDPMVKAPVPYTEEYHFSRHDLPEEEMPPTTTAGTIVQASSTTEADSEQPETGQPAADSEKTAAEKKKADEQSDASSTDGSLPAEGTDGSPAEKADGEKAEGKAPADQKPEEKSDSTSAASARADAVLREYEDAISGHHKAAPLFSEGGDHLEDFEWTILPAGPPAPADQNNQKAPALLLPGDSTPLLLEEQGSRTVLRKSLDG